MLKTRDPLSIYPKNEGKYNAHDNKIRGLTNISQILNQKSADWHLLKKNFTCVELCIIIIFIILL